MAKAAKASSKSRIPQFTVGARSGVQLAPGLVPAGEPLKAVSKNVPMIDVGADQVSMFRVWNSSQYYHEKYLHVDFRIRRKGYDYHANFFEAKETVDFKLWVSNRKSQFRWGFLHKIADEPAGGDGVQTDWIPMPAGYIGADVNWFPIPVTSQKVGFGLLIRVVRNNQYHLVRFKPANGEPGGQLLPGCNTGWGPLETWNHGL